MGIIVSQEAILRQGRTTSRNVECYSNASRCCVCVNDSILDKGMPFSLENSRDPHSFFRVDVGVFPFIWNLDGTQKSTLLMLQRHIVQCICLGTQPEDFVIKSLESTRSHQHLLPQLALKHTHVVKKTIVHTPL